MLFQTKDWFGSQLILFRKSNKRRRFTDIRLYCNKQQHYLSFSSKDNSHACEVPATVNVQFSLTLE